MIGVVALVAGACGNNDSLETDAPPTTRHRFPAAVVPTSTPAPTAPFGGVAVARATTTTTRGASTPGAAPTSTTVTAAPRVAPAATAMPAPRTAVGGASWQGVIVVAGGFDASGEASKRVDSYDPVTGAWSRGPDLPMPLHDLALGVLDGDLWAIGGFSREGDQSVARAETYRVRPGGTEWETGPLLRTPRGGAAVGALGGALIVVGGATTDGAALDTVETLGAGAAQWSEGAPIARKRAYASVVVGGGRVYVAGGRTEGVSTALRGVESWKPGGTWRPESALVVARSGAAAGGLCISGGENASGVVGTVECIAARTWTTRFTMSVPRHGLAAGVVDGWLHLIGGGASTGKSVNAAHEVFDLA